MAEPFPRGGKWYGRVKNAAGLWRNVLLAEARTKAQARELQDALALKSRRQRDGLEPMPTDRAFTVGALLRWWLHTYVAGKTGQAGRRGPLPFVLRGHRSGPAAAHGAHGGA